MSFWSSFRCEARSHPLAIGVCGSSVSCNTSFFFFNDTATTEIYTLSLHDALPIRPTLATACCICSSSRRSCSIGRRSEEHTSELQSHVNIVCRLLLEKKKRPIGVISGLEFQRDEFFQLHNVSRE